MSVAQGSCPSCGAPLTFGVGSSVSQVCRYCRHVVVRTDRDLQNLGKLADLALTPSPVAVGDAGSVAGRAMTVLGRVQLDHGEGPWDEWYLGFHDGGWGWLAYAQGNWYVTAKVDGAHALPPWDQVALESDLPLGAAGSFRAIEVKKASISSAEGELPMAVVAGQERFYVDLAGVGGGFATIDYGDQSAAPELFVGRQLPESALQVRAAGERAVTEIGTETLSCPACGGNLPALAPRRAERLACPFCGAISDIAARTVIEQQDKARASPELPLGTRGELDGQAYIVCGFVERSAVIEGERFGWQEYLLYAPGLGFRWLVKDEASWVWVTPVSAAEIDLSPLPQGAGFQGRSFRLRNRNDARVERVLGEFYWKVRIGETVKAEDFLSGSDVLSRERAGDEVAWSFGVPVPWSRLAAAFSLPSGGPGGRFEAPAGQSDAGPGEGSGSGGSETSKKIAIWALVVVFVLLVAWAQSCADCSESGGGVWHSGGGVSGGSRGGK